MVKFVRSGAAWLGLVLALALPFGVIALPVAAQGLPSLSLMATDGAFAGKWVYRSFSNSGDPKKTLASIALGLGTIELTETKGHLVGTRSGQGTTYQFEGTALYAPQQGATMRLHGTADVSGKTYNYDYFGYLMPTWSVFTGPSDTIVGTVLRTDPANPTNAPIIASFVATRQN